MTPLWTEAAKRWIDEFVAAAAFLTRIPFGRSIEPPRLSRGMRAFPIVGALLGAAAAIVLSILVAIGASGLLAAALTLAMLGLLTGALHEDALADMADGFGGGRNREHVLAIMRDSRIGTFGVTALALVLLAKAACFADLAFRPWFAVLAILAATSAFSRSLMVWIMAATPPARREGLSATAGTPSSDTVRDSLLIGAIPAALLLFAAAGLAAAVLVLAAGFGAAALIRALAVRRIGGQTGDICGAVQVLSETAMLSLAVIILH
jgi:adenosylcobinamide-GDP ribazoletransferase